jgi:hypothetical protein
MASNFELRALLDTPTKCSYVEDVKSEVCGVCLYTVTYKNLSITCRYTTVII